MTRDTKVQGLASIVLIVALLSSSALATRLSALAGKHKLTYTEQAEEGQPWEVTAGIAMGAFRGIFVNWLWIRANNLKEEGKFYESNQLAEVITRLQPRFPRVWVFHAWNMSYNISVSTQTPSERWDWVSAGVSLLRDRGLAANPNDLLIHKELAWIFLHKIGGYTDDANGYYKRRFAQEWSVVLGVPPPREQEDLNRKKAIAKCVARLRGIADAPETVSEVIAKEPAVATLRDRLMNEAKVGQPNVLLLAQYEYCKALGKSARKSIIQKGAGPNDLAFQAIVDDPAMAKAWEALNNWLRKRILIDTYHMEPDRMVRYTEKYGPIDWRHPAAHALYWSARGSDLAKPRYRGEIDRPEMDFLNTDRVTVQSIQDLFRGGDVYFDFLASFSDPNMLFLAMPNIHFVKAYADVLDEMFNPLYTGIFGDRAKRQFTMLWHGYENFIREAITYYYRLGLFDEANEWQTSLREDPRKNTTNIERLEELNLPLEAFVDNELKGEASRPAIAVAQVRGSLAAAFASGLVAGDANLFTRQFQYAQKLHRYYMEEQLRNTPAGGSTERMAHMDPDFEILSGQIFQSFITNLSMENAQTAYLNAPENLRCWAYDALRNSRFVQMADEDAKQGGQSFDRVFPKPDNFEAYAEDIRQRLKSRENLSKDIEMK
jgi:hypothetical protein